jgi:hypothetical protein
MEEPKFIIKLGDKYYVSETVLEYDPSHPGATAAQKEGVGHIVDAFNAGQKLQAVQVSAPSVSARFQTGPSH